MDDRFDSVASSIEPLIRENEILRTANRELLARVRHLEMQLRTSDISKSVEATTPRERKPRSVGSKVNPAPPTLPAAKSVEAQPVWGEKKISFRASARRARDAKWKKDHLRTHRHPSAVAKEKLRFSGRVSAAVARNSRSPITTGIAGVPPAVRVSGLRGPDRFSFNGRYTFDAGITRDGAEVWRRGGKLHRATAFVFRGVDHRWYIGTEEMMKHDRGFVHQTLATSAHLRSPIGVPFNHGGRITSAN